MNNIFTTCERLMLPLHELKRYEEKHRFYHNLDHIKNMINEAEKRKILSDELFIAIVFHDIIYDPRANDNEEKSAELFYSYIKNDEIKQAILETKTHKPTSQLARMLCELDLSGLNDLSTFIKTEDKIFKEYQCFDFKLYKENRLKFLKNYKVNQSCIDYFENKTRNIAVYTGSFNPFHKGHYDILQKAEEVFDKVIIARGVNLAKVGNKQYELPIQIKNRQIEEYSGLTTDFINDLGYDVTLIRGIRNASDLEFEKTQTSFLKDLKPDLKVVYFPCDKEFEHISSSAIKQLELYNKHQKYLL